MWVFADRSLPAWLLLRELQASKPITYTPKKTSFTVEAPAFGELQAGSSTSISVPQVRTGGLKVFWIVKDGSAVKKGDTLVEFDASEKSVDVCERFCGWDDDWERFWGAVWDEESWA